jgi:hypothetical protein
MLGWRINSKETRSARKQSEKEPSINNVRQTAETKRFECVFPGKIEDKEEKKLEGKWSTIHVPVRYELSLNKCHLEMIPSRNSTIDQS